MPCPPSKIFFKVITSQYPRANLATTMNEDKMPLVNPGQTSNPSLGYGGAPQQGQLPMAISSSSPLAMPVARPLDSCTDFSSATCPTPVEHHGAHHEHDEHCLLNCSDGRRGSRYFSPDELERLRQGPRPVDYYTEGARNLGGGAPEGDVFVYAQPVDDQNLNISTSDGVPLASLTSSAKARYDGYKGIVSSDPLLHMDSSGREIINYLHTHNTPPRVVTRVRGYHHEQRSRRVCRRDSDGNEYHETEHYTVTVTDFDYRIDISSWIFPHGYIATDTDVNNDKVFKTVPDCVQEFLVDGNALKTLKMEKVIDFDFEHLRSCVHGYIRSLGWWRGLEVTFPRCNYRVKVWKENCISKIWENCCGRLLCYLSIVGCIILNCYKCGHNQSHIKSYFRIEAHPLQVFEHLKPMLWAPGFAEQMLNGVGEVLRDAFW